MPLIMARPWRDKKTGVWHLRQRTPRDLLRLKRQPVKLPIGDSFATVSIGDVVQASLRTRDPAKAKELHAVADAALRRFWDAQRNGPTRLSSKQAAGLAGTLYRSFTDALGDDPELVDWQAVLATNARAKGGGFGRGALMIDPEARVKASLSGRFGPLADALLAREGLIVDPESRERLVSAVSAAMDDAARSLRNNAEGDFSPDPAAIRFPAWARPSDATPKPSGPPPEVITVARLFETWKAKQGANLAFNTVKRYAGSIAALIKFAKDRDVRTLTGDDLFAWAEHRRDKDGISPRAINRNDLVAVSSVFGWASSRSGSRVLENNPAEGVALDQPRRVTTREKTFREAEITAILRAALAVGDDALNPTQAFAIRWCPWLAAYSGARITELTFLEKDHVRDEGGVRVMDFVRTKSGEARTVPLHPHLIELGFLDFVASRPKGPLFYDPRRHAKSARTPPAEIRSRRVADWVRKTAKLPRTVRPNHAWRHTWKTLALSVGIDERLRDAITGHSVLRVARGYEAPTVAMLASAMARYPRYEVDCGP